MIPVQEADKIIQAQARNYGIEVVPFDQAIGRVLAIDLKADRDLPPFNRVSMDGIAISYDAFAQGTRSFRIKATLAAGDQPLEIDSANECVEIMTGAALPGSTDTIIRYEDLDIKDGIATVLIEQITQYQNIHFKGKDKKQGDVVATANQVISPALVGMAAAIGETEVRVKTLPKIVVISTGDELVDVDANPSPYQIRRSNTYTVAAALHRYSIQAELLHISDNPAKIKQQLEDCMQRFDVIIVSGGISMGKFDYVPQVLEVLEVKKLFHKVQQRPGKPFWFGKHANGRLVFALPGNPVSTYMCLQRYFIPWLEASISIPAKPKYAVLNKDIVFKAPLQYFLQVSLSMNDKGQLLATPLEGNGSGDFANMVEADAFMELPSGKSDFLAGEVYRVWTF